MTQEEKQHLLKEFCSRLPFDLKGRVYAETTNGEYDINGDMIFFNSPFDVILDGINTSTGELHVVAIGNEDTVDFIEDQQTFGEPYTIEEFKPYLRPMSSMTEVEKKELEDICTMYNGDPSSSYEYFGVEIFHISRYGTNFESDYTAIDWLNAHHFDYRGLIEKGLALKAPEGMYNTNTD